MGLHSGGYWLPDNAIMSMLVVIVVAAMPVIPVEPQALGGITRQAAVDVSRWL